MNAIRLGIVGAEAFAESPHLPVVESQPDHFQIVALYNSAPTRGVGWASRVHAAAYESLDDLLGNRQVDAVFVAGNDYPSRFSHAQKCLDAGRHVLLDPPMAGSSAQCDQLIQAARRKGVVLTVAHLRRWDHAFVHTRSRIDGGEVGEAQVIKLAASVTPNDNANLLKDGFHLFDYALMLNHTTLVEVSAAPNASGNAPPSTLSALLRFEKPPAVEVSFYPSFTTSAAMPLPRITVIGSRNAFSDTSIPENPNPQPFYDGVWNAIRQRNTPPVVAAGARNAVYVAECVAESARKGQAVRADRLLKAVE